MSSRPTQPPPPTPSGAGAGTPRKPPRGGPNPYLLLGIFVLGSASFFFLTDRRQRDPRLQDRAKPFANPLLPPRDAPRVQVDNRGKWSE
jgi:hypothetical protein